MRYKYSKAPGESKTGEQRDFCFEMEKANKENKVVKILLCLTSYLLDCLERFVKFISKNAYIQVSVFF